VERHTKRVGVPVLSSRYTSTCLASLGIPHASFAKSKFSRTRSPPGKHPNVDLENRVNSESNGYRRL